jgi:hypothetical protein
VLDFLFTYYSHRPASWSSGIPGRGRAARRRRVPRRARARPPADGTVALDPAALPDRHRTHRGVRPRPARRHRGPRRRGWAASACTSGRWSTGAGRARGTPRSRCGSAPPAPTPSSSRCPCTAPTTTPTGSSPPPPAPATPSPHPRRPGRRSSSPAACTRHGPLQVGLQARPRHPRRAAGRLLRPRRGRPRARHAGEPRTTSPTSATRRCRSRPRPARRVRPRPGRLRPPGGSTARPAGRLCDDLPYSRRPDCSESGVVR